MDNLEKKLENLPKPKLNFAADLKIKLKLYHLIILSRLEKFGDLFIPQNYFFKKTLAACLIAAAALSGTSIYAYSSDGVTPGHGLYGLKRAAETIEEKINFTQASKAGVYQKFSQRRLEEALHLSQEHSGAGQDALKEKVSDDIRKNIEDAINNINSAVNTAAEIKDEAKAKEAKNKIKEKEKSEIKYLDDIKQSADSNNDGEVVKKVEEARRAIDNYRSILDDNGGEPARENKQLNEDNEIINNRVAAPVKKEVNQEPTERSREERKTETKNINSDD